MNDLKVKHGNAPWPIEGTPICTKKNAEVRFSQYSKNLWLLRTACAGKDNRVLCKVYHLAEGDRLTHVLAAVCKRDYDPAVDIDRYLVDCFGSYGQLDGCPVNDGSGHADDVYKIVVKVVEKRPHGGIIAFFKRLFGKGEKAC